MLDEVTDISTLAEVIKILPDTGHTSVIAVSGFGGSGKSTLAESIRTHLEDAVVVPADDFVQDGYEQRSPDWACIDRQRIAHDILRAAESNAHIRYLAYDWEIHQLGKYRDVGKPKYLVLEGIGIMHPEIMPYFDMSIWIDCPLETALQQGIQRDAQAGLQNEELWRTVWEPNDREFFDTYRPDMQADCLFRTQ